MAKNEVRLIINEDTVIDYLEELAESFGVEIRYEIIKQEEDLSFVAGGLFKGEICLNNQSQGNDKG